MEVNPIAKAIEYFTVLQRKLGDTELGRKFRARAREIPGMIESIGLVPALSFCYGKAGAKTYKDTLESWFSEGRQVKGDYEKVGYSLHLLLTLLYLKDLKLIEESMVKNPIDAFRKLSREPLPITSKLLMPYLAEIKRLTEAVYPEEGGT